MRLLHPRSTLTLILFGFGVVALPLFIALGYAALYVDRLSEQGQTTVYNAARSIQDSRSLAETLTTLERTARQYLLLEEPGLYEVYEEGHEQFQSLTRRLQRFAPDDPQRILVRDIGQREQALFERISDEEQRAEISQEEVAELFVELGELVGAIRQASNRVIDREVNVMQNTATTAQQWLFWLGIALFPLTLISTAIFTILISRPIRQVDQAIRNLGDGDFEQPIRVSGPEDLRALGERLDWLRRRLQELEDQKTRFLRHMSHELKTPLTAIRESSDLLGDEVVGPLNEEQREITGILGDSGRRLQSLIENLLDFSRIQGARPSLTVSRLDVGQLVKSVLQEHKPLIRAKGIRVDSRLQHCELEGDREKLRTVVDNLVSNAIKFSPQNGRLTVRVVAIPEMIVVDVADEGPGIPAGERDKLFDAFFQGAEQPEGYVKGSGLGLSIAREYAVAHEGRIEVLDGNERGARIRVLLPRTDTGSSPA